MDAEKLDEAGLTDLDGLHRYHILNMQYDDASGERDVANSHVERVRRKRAPPTTTEGRAPTPDSRAPPTAYARAPPIADGSAPPIADGSAVPLPTTSAQSIRKPKQPGAFLRLSTAVLSRRADSSRAACAVRYTTRANCFKYSNKPHEHISSPSDGGNEVVSDNDEGLDSPHPSTRADRAPPTTTEGRAPTAKGRAPSTADGSAPPIAHGRAPPIADGMALPTATLAQSTSATPANRAPTDGSAPEGPGSPAPRLLVSMRAKSGYKYVTHDPRAAAYSKPYSIHHPRFRSAGFKTALAAATHLSKSGILTQYDFEGAQTSRSPPVRVSSKRVQSTGVSARGSSLVVCSGASLNVNTNKREQCEPVREGEFNVLTGHPYASKRTRYILGWPASADEFAASSITSSSSVIDGKSSASSSTTSSRIDADSSRIKIEKDEPLHYSTSCSNHSASYGVALSGIEELPLATQNDKCRVFLFQAVIACRAQASRAGTEAVAQLGAFMLTTLTDEEFSFFKRIKRTDFEFDLRCILVVPQAGIRLVHVFGTEHTTFQIGASLRTFYRNYLYMNHDDASWDRKLDEQSLSFVLVDNDGTIVAAQTVRIAHTVCNEPVFYVALIAQSEQASSEEGVHIEKPSKFLASELTNFAYSCVPINGVVHILTQSVGYRYANYAGVIRMMHDKSEFVARGRHYWAKHCKPTEPAMLFGAQLALMPEFAEGDCLFMHKELRHMAPSLTQTAQLDRVHCE